MVSSDPLSGRHELATYKKHEVVVHSCRDHFAANIRAPVRGSDLKRTDSLKLGSQPSVMPLASARIDDSFKLGEVVRADDGS